MTYTTLIERLGFGQMYDRRTGLALDQSAIMDEASDAIKALQVENERLKAFADLGVEMYGMTTTVHSPNIEFSEQLKIVPGMWRKCMEERDALQAKLDALQTQEPVAWVLLRKDEDGLEPVMFYGGKNKPEGEFKDRFVLRPVCFADTAPQTTQAVPWKCINGKDCQRGWQCSESYCQEHCVFRSSLTRESGGTS